MYMSIKKKTLKKEVINYGDTNIKNKYGRFLPEMNIYFSTH